MLKVGQAYRVKVGNKFKIYAGDKSCIDNLSLILNIGDRIKLVEIGKISCIHSTIGIMNVRTRSEIYIFNHEENKHEKLKDLWMFCDEDWINFAFEECEDGMGTCSGKCSSCDNSIYEKILKERRAFFVNPQVLIEIDSKYDRNFYRMAVLGMRFFAEKKGKNVLIEAPNLHGAWLVSMENFKKLVKIG